MGRGGKGKGWGEGVVRAILKGLLVKKEVCTGLPITGAVHRRDQLSAFNAELTVARPRSWGMNTRETVQGHQREILADEGHSNIGPEPPLHHPPSPDHLESCQETQMFIHKVCILFLDLPYFFLGQKLCLHNQIAVSSYSDLICELQHKLYYYYMQRTAQIFRFDGGIKTLSSSSTPHPLLPVFSFSFSLRHNYVREPKSNIWK